MGQRLTIGELSRRTGVSVKRLRFYSDQGLLPPAARTRSGYRLYTEEHAVRIDLIRALRDAGIGLEEIGKVLRRDMPLDVLLQLRLGTVEAHIAGLQRIAVALRLAIQSGATEDNLRRITMVTQASNADRRQAVEAFYEKVIEGLPIKREQIADMVDASAPGLPDSPSPGQLAAWIELQGLLDDPALLDCKRINISDMWSPRVGLQFDAFIDAQEVWVTATSQARARGISPTSEEAAAIVERFTATMAAASHEDPAVVRARMRVKYDPRGARFWELVAIMKGDPALLGRFDDWQWFGEAVHHHLAAPAVPS